MTCFTIEIPRWHPVPLNKLMNCHWGKRDRLKKDDQQMIFGYTRNIPKAEGKRRVSLHITLDKGQRAFDPDAYTKSLNDALVAVGMLVDDNRQHVELMPVTFSR